MTHRQLGHHRFRHPHDHGSDRVGKEAPVLSVRNNQGSQIIPHPLWAMRSSEKSPSIKGASRLFGAGCGFQGMYPPARIRPTTGGR